MAKEMKLNNGLVFVWAENGRNGNTVTGTCDGIPFTVHYSRDGFVTKVVSASLQDIVLGARLLEGIRQTSGTWKLYKKAAPGTLSDNKKKSGREYEAHVYFWLARVNGRLSPRHSHKRVVGDPMGKKLLSQWNADFRAFIGKHPELCSKRTVELIASMG